jgi:alkanesulfonate monooxygenase SsuD/methylene tetrahydromethanopterin reductase-like flavin-dependent oxidoreductase (luciferase family)
MDAVEAATTRGDGQAAAAIVSERWLHDVALYGSPARVRAELEQWFDAGMRTPALVPSSTGGGQATAYREVFDTFK